MSPSSSVFRFRKFLLQQHKSVMLVGTDSVLLGSWFDLSGASHVLDVGCGTGVLSMMAAQRHPDVKILAVDKNENAVDLATHNANQSRWKDRITVRNADVFSLNLPKPNLVSHIICNPPYFISGTKSPFSFRMSYRHTKAHFFDMFFSHMYNLSRAGASLGIVIPHGQRNQICALALSHGWYVKRELRVRHNLQSEFSLCLLEWNKFFEVEPAQPSQLILYDENGIKTPAYNTLTQAFYL